MIIAGATLDALREVGRAAKKAGKEKLTMREVVQKIMKSRRCIAKRLQDAR